VFDVRGLRVWVAGHSGMVGSAVARKLKESGAEEVLGWRSVEVDLTDRAATVEAALDARPDAVVLAAGRVGGIAANLADPVGFVVDNLRIQTNVMEAAHLAEVDRLLLIGSSVVYPMEPHRALDPSMIFAGVLDPDRIGYAVAKLAGMTLLQSYRRQYDRRWIVALPANTYGPGDDFSTENAHVIPALVRRFSEAADAGASEIAMWGSGAVRREFLHVEDLAAACVRLLSVYDGDEPVNVGPGEDVTIGEVALLVASEVGFHGQLVWDSSRPDGAPRRLLDVQPLRQLGWSPTIGLTDGIAGLVDWYRTSVHGPI